MKNDLTGNRFGRLTAIERTGDKRWGCYLWRCLCDCGNSHIAASNSLKSGLVKSCGCLHSEVAAKKSFRHGGYGTRTYKIWGGIIQRCCNKNNNSYSKYGGKGITVCDSWRDYETFLSDMGECPDGASIDRINGNLGYSPDNCRWATTRTQRMNQSRGTITEDLAERIRAERAATGKGPKALSEQFGVTVGVVSGVIYLGNLSPSKTS